MARSRAGTIHVVVIVRSASSHPFTFSILSSWSCYDQRGRLRGVAALLEDGSGIAGGGAFTHRVRRAGQLRITTSALPRGLIKVNCNDWTFEQLDANF